MNYEELIDPRVRGWAAKELIAEHEAWRKLMGDTPNTERDELLAGLDAENKAALDDGGIYLSGLLGHAAHVIRTLERELAEARENAQTAWNEANENARRATRTQARADEAVQYAQLLAEAAQPIAAYVHATRETFKNSPNTLIEGFNGKRLTWGMLYDLADALAAKASTTEPKLKSPTAAAAVPGGPSSAEVPPSEIPAQGPDGSANAVAPVSSATATNTGIAHDEKRGQRNNASSARCDPASGNEANGGGETGARDSRRDGTLNGPVGEGFGDTPRTDAVYAKHRPYCSDDQTKLLDALIVDFEKMERDRTEAMNVAADRVAPIVNETLTREYTAIRTAVRDFLHNLQFLTYPGYVCGDSPRYTIPEGPAFQSAVESLRKALNAPADGLRPDDATDAARWRALVGCERVKVLGHAGLTVGSPFAPIEQPYAHIGLELWTTHCAPTADSDESRRTLTAFADKARGALRSEGEGLIK